MRIVLIHPYDHSGRADEDFFREHIRTIDARLARGTEAVGGLWRKHDENRWIARTDQHVSANRIPRVVCPVVRGVPATIAAPMLRGDIRKHARTFAGSSECRVSSGPVAVATLVQNNLKLPGAVLQSVVFERLFRVLINPGSQVRHVEDKADGQTTSRFEIDFRPPALPIKDTTR